MRSAATIDLRQQSPRHCRGTFCAVNVPSSDPLPLAGRAREGVEAGTLPVYRKGPKRSHGMTLVELLVVLALLVVIGSIVVPVFTGSFASVRLRRAGDQVLTRWSQARARAIETGEVYQFT